MTINSMKTEKMPLADAIRNEKSRLVASLLVIADLLGFAAPQVASANTIKVKSGAASGGRFDCILRQALEDHNAKGEPNSGCGPR